MNICKMKIRKYLVFEMIFIIILVAICQVRETEGRDESTMKPPGRLPWYWWADGVVNKHFTNMTAELVKDALIKLKSAKSVQAKFKSKANYKVGVITANIQTLFEKMLIIYRDVADIGKIRQKWWLNTSDCSAVNDTINGLSIAQSYFNRIRLEKRLFQAQMKEHAQQVEEKRKKMEQMFGGPLPPGAPLQFQEKLPVGGMYSRRLNRDDDIQIPLDEYGIPDFSLPKSPPNKMSPIKMRHRETRRNMQTGDDGGNAKKHSRPGLANPSHPRDANPNSKPGIPKSFSEVNKELEFSLQALKKRGRRFGGAMPESNGKEPDISHDSVKQTPDNKGRLSDELDHRELGQKKSTTTRPTKKRIWKVGLI